MATITIHPEHVDGLRYMIDSEFESACDSQDPDRLRELIPVGDIVGWRGYRQPWRHEPVEIPLSAELLDKLTTFAWEAGNEIMADVHLNRVGGNHLADPKSDERIARSMLAFHEHMQAEKVVV